MSWSSRAPAPPLLGLAADHVATPDGRLEAGVVWVDVATGTVAAVTGGVVDHTDPGNTAAVAAPAGAGVHQARIVHLGPRIISPGYVDLHVHGGDGRQVNGDDPTQVAEALDGLAAFHVTHGTTAMLATTVSDSPERLAATVAGIARATAASQVVAGASPGAPRLGRVAGCHLEGPFIAPERAGAQDSRAIRPPDRAELRRLLEIGDGTVRLVTLAPELPGADDLIADCLDAGAVVSLGHTGADYDTARRAFDAGAAHVTHLFNAMAPLHHRRPGLVTAALAEPAVTVELVCDLVHVHPAVVSLVARTASGRVALVTDASPATGLPDGEHMLGRVVVRLGGARVALASDPAVLAGSALTMDRAVGNLVTAAAVMPADALAAATTVPARVVGPPSGGAAALGRIEPGAPADLVVLEPDLALAATIVGGAVVSDPGSLLA
ncbi:MAG: N-acetylglucosamine-6-phosphate deacetylase [Acidimicrobiales bacterium]